MDIDGFILIGGASSRMGADKARLRLDGKTFVERIAAALWAVTDRVSVVGAREAAAHANLPNVADLIPRWGALGGIHAALKASQSEWAAIVACDLPFVTGELFSRLLLLCEQPDAAAAQIERRSGGPSKQDPHAGSTRRAVDSEGAVFDAVVPVQIDGRKQPLCALYRRQPCLTKAEQLIALSERRPRALLAKVHTRWVKPDELADLRGADYFFFNINTPEDFARAKQIVDRELGR